MFTSTITNWLQIAIAYLHHNPQSAGWIAFIIAFAEALAIIGTIVPGSVTMTAIGTLIGSQVIPATSTIIWAVAGAVCGDSVGYAIGLFYKSRIHKIWPFTRYPNLLKKGEDFFRKHGGKGIILGRFFGPARSIVPLIAGTFNMSPLRFLLAAIPSASLWAIMYLTPGILLGAVSLELPPKLALHLISGALLILIMVIIATWIIRKLVGKFAKNIDHETKKIWIYIQRHHSTHWISTLLTDPRHPRNHRQLILAFYALVTGCLFLFLALGVVHHGLITELNYPIYNLLRSLRSNYIDNVMIVLTLLADNALVVFSALLFLWLAYKRYWRTASHWALLLIISFSLRYITKLLINSARPGNLLNGPVDTSFPSGHTLFAFTVFGFLAVLISQQLKPKHRKIPYIVTLYLGSAIAFSRIFLGVHWLTDIIGGALLATAAVLVATISYRRGNMPYIRIKQFIIICAAMFIVSTVPLIIHDFKKFKHNYTVYWPSETISYLTWQKTPSDYLPLSRDSRLGEPIEPLNIQWLEDLPGIKNALLAQGWETHAGGSSVVSILKRLATSETNHPIPLVTELYHNRPPALLMTKDLKNNKGAIILRLWNSDIKIRGTEDPLWIGTVNYYYLEPELHSLREKYNTKKLFLGATSPFKSYLYDFNWHQVNYQPDKQPEELVKLHWDGNVLLITEER